MSRKYHNTSLFLFGQLSSKLATNTKTMTIICVTLTFSICLFVIAPVLTGWSLGYLDSRAVYDIQIQAATTMFMKWKIFRIQTMRKLLRS